MQTHATAKAFLAWRHTASHAATGGPCPLHAGPGEEPSLQAGAGPARLRATSMEAMPSVTPAGAPAAVATAADEVEGLERVLTRLAMTDDDKLEKVRESVLLACIALCVCSIGAALEGRCAKAQRAMHVCVRAQRHGGWHQACMHWGSGLLVSTPLHVSNDGRTGDGDGGGNWRASGRTWGGGKGAPGRRPPRGTRVG